MVIQTRRLPGHWLLASCILAGLRSYNKKMPEEINRVLTDHISNLVFTPTDKAVENLRKESITENVFIVGDVMYDAFLYNSALAEQKYSLEKFGLEPKKYLLATIHRAENTDSREHLLAIFNSFAKLGDIVFLHSIHVQNIS
jgi:UDP-N-acetylglucosamine 2-epimerase